MSDIRIIESGNGYVKYSDGRLEMWGRQTFSNVNIDNRGSTSVYGYNSTQYRIDFPVVAIEPCQVSIVDFSNTGAWVCASTGGTLGQSNFAFWFYCNSIAKSGRHIVSWRATGRWK